MQKKIVIVVSTQGGEATHTHPNGTYMIFQHSRVRAIFVLIFSTSLLLAVTAETVAQSPSDEGRELSVEQTEAATELLIRALELYEEGKYGEAAVLTERKLRLEEDVLGTNHPELISSLNFLAFMNEMQSDYATAESLYQRAVKIRERALGPEHPDTAASLNRLGLLYSSQGDYAAAEPLYERALKINEKALGPDDPGTALSLNNLAFLYYSQANYAAAEPLYKRALDIKEKALEPDDPEMALSLNNLASLYESQANYPAAEPLYERALGIREKVCGPDHPDTALSLNNLAFLYYTQGNNTAAEPLYERALAIREKVLGPNHADTAVSANNLALVYDDQGNLDAAESLYKRALEVNEQVLGAEHPDTARSLNNLAAFYSDRTNYAAAEPLYKRALAIRETAVGPEHPDTAICLNHLAFLYAEQGNYTAAEPLYKRALTIRGKALGAEHPDTAVSLNNLAWLHCSKREFTQAVSLIDRERRGQRAHVSRVLPSLPAREQALFLTSNYVNSFYTALSLATGIDDAVSFTSWLINGKGVAQEALAQRNLQTRDIDHPTLGPIAKELSQVRTRLASLAMDAAESGQEQQQRTEMERLRIQERQLSGQLGSNVRTTSDWIEIAQIQDTLSADSVFIDIARFDVMNLTGKEWAPGDENPTCYAAGITFPHRNSKSVVIDLGEAELIDQLVRQVRQQMADDASDAGEISAAGEEKAAAALMEDLSRLAHLIWKPLVPHVGDAKQIVLSPDGALWLAPWSALPANDANDEYLLERYDIRFVISGRDLVVKPDQRQTTAPVILANPEFDQQESQKKSAIKGIFKTLPPQSQNATRSFSAQSALPKVKPLPNTGIEALAIRPHIETYTRRKAGLYKEQYALERVAKVLRSPQIATFATHGFFLPTQETNMNDRNLAVSENTRSVALDTNGQAIENPLLRCGLLLSGCNNREASVADDDGILTGMEIVSIDFRGTELVVLSACETGVGDVRNGEGVAGLRQAFQLAGAEAVVATLWQVPDRESALLMSKFFEQLAAGDSKSEALRSAQIARIESRRKRYGAAHPFYWAAFTLTGQ